CRNLFPLAARAKAGVEFHSFWCAKSLRNTQEKMVSLSQNQTSDDLYATASFVAEGTSRFCDSWRIMKKLLAAAAAATFLLLTNATAQVSTPAMSDEMKAKCGDQNHSTYLL